MTGGVCTQCGAELPAAAVFCSRCGAAVEEPASPPPESPPQSESPGRHPGAKTPGLSSRKRAVIYGAIASVVSLALIGGVLVATRDTKSEPGAGPGEVFLEPADYPGEDPFTEDLDTNTAPAPIRLAGASSPSPPSPTSPVTPPSPGRVGIRSVQGVAPGLYGGTANESACDAERLVRFLRSDPDKAAAWAAVQGITPAAIPEFVAGLTPVVLRADTRVTNHGYRDGRATPLQSVLQAGTAALVDDLGIPRVKCGCGNPLAPPQAHPEGVRYTGKRWSGFRPANVLVIVNTVQVRVTKFVLLDLTRSGFFTRPVGTPPPGSAPADGEILIDTFCDLLPDDCRPPSLVPGGPQSRPGEPALGTGDVQITLRWSSTADLDLAVTDPAGETVAFQAPTSSSGGRLDVDSNAGCNNPTTTPVENIFWPAGMSPDGEYTITVTYYQECPGGTGAQAFELTVLMGGVPVDVQAAAARGGDPTFTLLVAGGSTGPDAILTAAQTGSLEPGGQYVAKVTKEGSLPGARPPGPPHHLFTSVLGPDVKIVPGRITINWLWAFDDTITEGYELTVEPGGETFVLPGEMAEFTLPGLEPGTEYTFTLVAFNQFGKSPPATITGTTGEGPPEEEEEEEAPPPPPQPETLEEYCDRTYPPPPTVPAENPQWTLCMHDPTSADAIDAGSLPVPVPPSES